MTAEDLGAWILVVPSVLIAWGFHRLVWRRSENKWLQCLSVLMGFGCFVAIVWALEYFKLATLKQIGLFTIAVAVTVVGFIRQLLTSLATVQSLLIVIIILLWVILDLLKSIRGVLWDMGRALAKQTDHSR